MRRNLESIGLFLVFALVLLLGTASAAEENGGEKVLAAPSRSSQAIGPFAEGAVIPHWQKGFLIQQALSISNESQRNVFLYDSEGKKLFEATIWPAGSVKVDISNVVLAPSGELVATIFAQREDGTEAFLIVQLGRDGKTKAIIQTNPYIAHQVCVDADDTVWTGGGIRTMDSQESSKANQLRHWNFQTGLLESYLPLASFGTTHSVASNLGKGRQAFLACLADDVVLYSGVAQEYVRFNKRDHTVQRFVMKTQNEMPMHGMAITANAELYASFYDWDKPSAADGLYYLKLDERSGSATWSAVAPADAMAPARNDFGWLFGADGDNLVHSKRKEFSTLYWSQPKSATSTVAGQ